MQSIGKFAHPFYFKTTFSISISDRPVMPPSMTAKSRGSGLLIKREILLQTTEQQEEVMVYGSGVTFVQR